MNNLKNIENSLRYIAKRNKFIKFTTGTVVAFLIMGYNAFAEEVMSREDIGSKVKDLYSTVQKAKKENKDKIKNAKLELIQLMEQADQVIKSPWASWQFGLNYIYDNSKGEYKGYGDKEKRYPYEGVFTRSQNVYERSVSSKSIKYSELRTGKDTFSSLTNLRAGLTSGYGIASIKGLKEPLVSFEMRADVNPRNINKNPITIGEKVVVVPKQPTSVKFAEPQITVQSPQAPTVVIATPTVQVPTIAQKKYCYSRFT